MNHVTAVVLGLAAVASTLLFHAYQDDAAQPQDIRPRVVLPVTHPNSDAVAFVRYQH